MNVQEILKQTVRDYFTIFFFFLAKKRDNKRGQLIKSILSALVVCTVLFTVIGFPFLKEVLYKHGSKDIHLNIFEVNDGTSYDNTSYLCKFDFKKRENVIMSYSLSNDSREVVFSFPEGDVKKKNCKAYYGVVPYTDPYFQGTTINVFYAKGLEYYLNGTGKQKNMLIRTGSPIRVVVRNPNALIVNYTNTNQSVSLVRDMLHYERELQRVKSKSQTYLDYSGTFNFVRKNGSDAVATFGSPATYLFETPLLEEVNFTSLSTFKQVDSKFVANFGFKEKYNADRKTFIKVTGELLTGDAELEPYNGLTISKFDYVDPDCVPLIKTSFKIAAAVVGALSGMFLILFVANLVSAFFNRKKSIKDARAKATDKNLVDKSKAE